MSPRELCAVTCGVVLFLGAAQIAHPQMNSATAVRIPIPLHAPNIWADPLAGRLPPLPAQEPPLGSTIPLSTGVWVPIGPAPLSGFGLTYSGRVTGIAAHPADGNTVYIAAAGGGVWGTNNGGIAWNAKTDNQAISFMGSIGISKLNPSVIYAGTGEANYSADSFYGGGILVSIDGGSVWSLKTGPSNIFSTNAFCIPRIAVDPTVADGSVAYATTSSNCANGSFAGGSGVYKTIDTGTTWSNVTSGITAGSFSTVFSDFVIDSANSNNLYTAIGYAFGGALNGIYRSTDGGATWALLSGTNAPAGSSTGRFALALSADGAHLYAAVTDPSTYALLKFVRSDNPTATTASSVTFTDLSVATPNVTGDQGWYDLALLVSPTDATTVYLSGAAGSNSILKGTSSGTVWTDISGARTGTVTPHADHHALAFDANGNLLDGDDGGIFRYNPVADNWTDLNGNLQTIQFTGVDSHPTNPNAAAGGSQDNGTAVFSGSLTWVETEGGDGGLTKFHKQTPTVLYHQIPVESFGANFFRVSTDGGSSWTTRTADIVADEFAQNFYAPFAVDPSNGDHVLYGTNGLWETTNEGTSWAKIATSGVGGFSTVGRCGSTGVSCIDAVAIAPSAPSQVFAMAGGGKIFFTADHSTSWAEHDLPAGAGRVNEIDFAPFTSTTAYAVTNSFDSLHSHVYKTVNSGAIWSNISSNLPDVPVWSLQVGVTSNTLYVGTDTGVYASTDGGASWSVYGTGFPRSQVVQVQYNPTLFTLTAGTHGRGAWQTLTQNAKITNVSSSTIDGSYGVGASISIQVTLNENVTVTGTPQLSLNSGGTANYASGSGTNILTFIYTVVSGENSSKLDYTSSTSLSLNGGKILDPSATAAVLTLAAPGASGSLSFSKNIVINTSLVGPPAPALFGPNDGAISQPVSISLTWISSIGATSYDVYFGTSSTPPFVSNTIVPTYTPGALNLATTYYWKIVAKNSNGSTSSATWSFATMPAGTPIVSGSSPASGSGFSQTFIFTFADSSGWQDLSVVNVLINRFLDGIGACYVAFAPASASSGYLYLVDNAGDGGYASGSPMLLPSSGTLQNGQCTISGSGSSVSTSGNTLTLHLAITFSFAFAGHQVFYLAARNNGGNSGWQALGTWAVPGTTPVGPAVGAVSPPRSATPGQTYAFTFTDTSGYTDLSVVNILINNFLDGIGACYVAFAPTSATSGYLYLVDDAGDGGYAGGSPIALPSSGTLQNSQCAINATGSSVLATGNILTLNLAIAFNPAFAGNQVIYLAARNNTTGNSGWQAVGSVTVP